jgi:phosphoglycerol transferase MdoB-like AlkP superfamily enzyme
MDVMPWKLLTVKNIYFCIHFNFHTAYMKNRIIAAAAYGFFWLLFFAAARLIFLLIRFSETASESIVNLIGSFTHGLKHDIATAGYYMLIPMLAITVSFLLHGKWIKRVLKIYSYLLIVFSAAIVTGDAMVYQYWGFRLEYSVVEYLKTPGDAMASASTIQAVAFILIAAAISVVFIILCNRLINKFFSDFDKATMVIPSVVAFLVLTGALIIPIRGGFGIVPLNAGSVYFTDRLFPNHASINVLWNVGHTAVYNKPKRNPYEFSDYESALGIVKRLTASQGETQKILKTDRPNILIFILESFGSYITDISEPDSVVTPRFREYIPEGVFFTRLYAAGSRTDKALPAILSGYPSPPTTNVLREPKKTQSMPGIIKLLDSAGYKTYFWYGGNIDFANMKPYLITTGFRNRVTVDDFDPSQCNSKWGVHDDILFSRLQDSLKNYRQPFACAVLTLSSHEPFEVPMEPVFKGKDVVSMFKNSVYYTDNSLGQFLDKARETEWWNNTLVILIADHCRRNSEKMAVYSEEIFKIPMLWLGGALAEKNLKIDKYSNQADLPYTIARQLGMNGNFMFSKDLLAKGSNSYAFYTYNEGFAFITDTASAIFDIKLEANVMERGINPESAVSNGKSILQVLYDDYLKR